MKKGKYIPMGYYKNIKIGYGTVDFVNLKTIFLKFNSWVLPDDDDDYDEIIKKTRRRIKHYFLDQKINLFKKETIVDLDIRTKGIKLYKKSFMNLEITLYVDNQFDIKTNEIKILIRNIIRTIIDEYLINKNLFNFHKIRDIN